MFIIVIISSKLTLIFWFGAFTSWSKREQASFYTTEQHSTFPFFSQFCFVLYEQLGHKFTAFYQDLWFSDKRCLQTYCYSHLFSATLSISAEITAHQQLYFTVHWHWISFTSPTKVSHHKQYPTISWVNPHHHMWHLQVTFKGTKMTMNVAIVTLQVTLTLKFALTTSFVESHGHIYALKINYSFPNKQDLRPAFNCLNIALA